MATFSINFVLRISVLATMMVAIMLAMIVQSNEIKAYQQSIKMQEVAKYIDSEITNVYLSLQKVNETLNKSIYLPYDPSFYYLVNLSCVGGNIQISAETPSLGKIFIIKKRVKCNANSVSGLAFPGENCIMGKRIDATHVNITLVRDCIV
ncbi:hypothetical protein DRN74_00025 [Candidatus Micrarchaeota archaeon]|nr:MAG: hypothetical protein DRN74_00025 [Candidatus Micrarchaeota archaeon]